jgi:hypothetical protein
LTFHKQNGKSETKQRNEKHEKDIFIYEHASGDAVTGFDVGMPEHSRRHKCGIAKGKPPGASRIQIKDRNHAQAATANEPTASRGGLDRVIQRKIVLRIPDRDQGQNSGWQPNTVQRL